MYMCVGCGCSLLLIYVFSLYLRASRKIDSSIGLPSLNKVVTYLLTYLIYILGGFIDIRQNKSYITQYDEAPTDLNEMAGKEVDMSQSPHW